MTTQGGVIKALSASQAEEFDPQQTGGCPRRWYFHRIARLPVPESGRAQEDGDAGHALFALYYRTGQRPRRAKMAKAVNGALDAGHLPPREPGQLIESRFDGQPARDGDGGRLPLDTTRTLWLGGVPWDGYVDLRFCRTEPFGPLAAPGMPAAGGTFTVLDHKFSSDIHAYAKSDPLATVQMPVYALDSLRIWPEAKNVELVHHYVSRRGVDSFIRHQLVTVDQIEQRAGEIDMLVARMRLAAAAPSAEDVPGNRASCHTWSGCPFQSRCSVFKEKPKMNLSSDELEWLKVLGTGKAPVAGPEAERAAKQEIASAAGALDPGDEQAALADKSDDDDDPFAVFEAPKASDPQAQVPVCVACGTELHSENGSQRDGVWKHIGCPAGVKIGSAAAPDVTVARGSGDGPTAISSKCSNCPHSPHPGAACTGKRGRGACRCGTEKTAGSVPEEDHGGKLADCEYCGALAPSPHAERCNRPGAHLQPLAIGHLPTCIQNDAGKWLCMEGCTAEGREIAAVGEVARAHGETQGATGRAAEEHADDVYSHLLPGVAELARVQDELGRGRGWTGTLRVEVNLGPGTLALLQRLIGGR